MIKVEVENLAEVQSELNALSRRFSDLTEVMQNVAIRMQETNVARLNQGIQADGQPFAPHSPYYIRYTASGNKIPRPYQILVHTGKLRQGILPSWTAKGAKVSAGNNESRSYVAKHQFGSPEDRIPARPFLGVSVSDLADIGQIMTNFVEKSIDG